VIAVDWKSEPVQPQGGNDTGYLTANRCMRDAVQAAGVVIDPMAQLSVSFETPLTYRRARSGSKLEVLYTMWESPDFPLSVRPELDQADVVLVPSTFCRDLLAPYTKRRPLIVPLGFDPATFSPPATDREWKRGESFQWLMVGAPNARKGWDVVEDIWDQTPYGHREDSHLYAKTVMTRSAITAAVNDGWEMQESGVLTKRRIVLDPRRLPVALLAETYRRSHAFLFPTAGEGWGLTLLEAMATGLPCIATRYSGLLDFTNPDTVRYVDWKPVVTGMGVDGDIVNSALADLNQVVEHMASIQHQYRAAVRMGKRAARDVRQRFTWQHAGAALARTLSDIAARRSTFTL